MGCAGVIVAAGSSRRMGFDKLAASLDGVPVLRRSVERLMAVPEITRVIVVCAEDRFRELLGGAFAKELSRVDGGAERQDSVLAGLEALQGDDELVAVHDGARPLVEPSDISSAIAAASAHGAATLARPATETLKRADASGIVVESVDRQGLWFTETPQVFRASLLREAYEAVEKGGLHVTDEVSAAESIGLPVRIVPSSRPNPKITVPADLDLATALLR
ncbi:2-C-methyl-D-erythritol 4-phosphate cytidylyltransferase [Haloferula sp. A504]|uniref:2-C-methyl-D-erythritol 4-phosphate cytidylyltransferase n=1 Tax=Haloferula sp. A504 TaxID=3373601 RepID=UPI0031BF7CB1|nr:2-C-methyl-D-erythritol 4-phosphate cytidylyltransferase [Verrucomicrobiaceae bacterium E54]